MSSKFVFLIGGARSGKSRYAQQMAIDTGKEVLFVATATSGDAEMAAKIEVHKKDRPANWHTLEASYGLGPKIAETSVKADVVLVDCITMLVANLVIKHEGKPDIEQVVRQEIASLIESMDNSESMFIAVSNEVGMALVPDNSLGRQYRDNLGRANQFLAARADEVYLLVAGIPVKVK
ncbi:bifunctional adenosylcobinamide kinase/adenosylcobinamide-phosphate guanylyltransferase [Chloroflexota bacterium]